ncbi:MAG TPA: hypothetical protein VK781_07350 [Solirubrobacteraceae bacterium]|jgi:hypothetical protein|nr:hypothetical protein [Solirubrobacteraceae bacterium]
MSIPKPWWFDRNRVMVSTAATCGVSKSGRLLVRFDPVTGQRVVTRDPETGELTDVIDDQLLRDMEALYSGEKTDTLQFADCKDVSMRLAVPTYYDRRYHDAFAAAMQSEQFDGFTSASIGELASTGQLELRHGHGSALKDLRVGDVPYIKVSDLRAGLININPTNRVPLQWAEIMWRGSSSGLRAFDLICPERASKNIGDFCVLMPGQEQILVTKEVIVLRPGPNAVFDPFYLLWAMTLGIVRAQWRRVVFMQTNREDVGHRYLEIEVPIPPDSERAREVSEPFRTYFTAIAHARNAFRAYLDRTGDHHFFVSGGEVLPTDEVGVSPETDVAAANAAMETI